MPEVQQLEVLVAAVCLDLLGRRRPTRPEQQIVRRLRLRDALEARGDQPEREPARERRLQLRVVELAAEQHLHVC